MVLILPLSGLIIWQILIIILRHRRNLLVVRICIQVCSFSSVSLGRDENFRANFAQYGLDSYFVDILIADAGRLGLREIPLFDAIITDRE